MENRKKLMFAGISILIAAIITVSSWLMVNFLPKIEIHNNSSQNSRTVIMDAFHDTIYILPINIFLLIIAISLIVIMIIKTRKQKVLTIIGIIVLITTVLLSPTYMVHRTGGVAGVNEWYSCTMTFCQE